MTPSELSQYRIVLQWKCGEIRSELFRKMRELPASGFAPPKFHLNLQMSPRAGGSGQERRESA